MKKDLNYYKELLRMDEKIFKLKEDVYWQVSYKRLPKIVGKGIGVAEAERNLFGEAMIWVETAIEAGLEVIEKTEKEKRVINPVIARPCPFCGGSNITIDICAGEAFVGCADCDYEVSVGDVDFEKKTPAENQAKKLWNNMRPIEDKYKAEIQSLRGL